MQYRILRTIAAHRALDEESLGELIGITPEEALQHLTKLKEKNLVEQVPGLNCYRPTHEGKVVAKSIHLLDGWVDRLEK